MPSKVDDLRAVVKLAALTAHRTRAEQHALLRLALDVDRLVNVQLLTNRHLDAARATFGVDVPLCTYSADHDKKRCVCRGARVAYEPVGGWSRLHDDVEASWDGEK